MPRRSHLVPLIALTVLVTAGVFARRHLGIEASLEGVQVWVRDLGWWGPVAYVSVVVFRQFLALPAALLLIVGGLCFGGALGTVLGTIGVIASGLMKFAIARAIGRDWLHRHYGASFERIEARIVRLGPALIGLGTAYPVGPLSPLHWGAGLAPISLTSFALALVLGAPIRASAYSYLGASLLDVRSPAFTACALALAVAIVLPVAFPPLRRRLFVLEERRDERASA